MKPVLLGFLVGVPSGLLGLAFPAGSMESFAAPVLLANILVLVGASLG